MFKITLFLILFLVTAIPSQKQNIIDVLEQYNKYFGEANYSKIVNSFDYPTSFNLSDKTIIASSRFKLKLIYKKLRGDLPDYYSYSKWNKIDVELIDDNIAIVNASFSRYDNNDIAFYSGSAQYHLRYKDEKWKIYSLTPYKNIEVLN